MSIAGIICVQVWPLLYGHDFPINGQWIFFGTIAACSLAYVLVSLVGSNKEPFNLERLLHKGKYAVARGHIDVREKPKLYMRIFGITREFSRFDRFTTYIVVGWFILLFIVFVVGTLCGFIFEISSDAWAHFWYWYMWQMIEVLFVSTIWLTLGGLRDVRKMSSILSSQERGISDDGRVSHDRDETIIQADS